MKLRDLISRLEAPGLTIHVEIDGADAFEADIDDGVGRAVLRIYDHYSVRLIRPGVTAGGKPVMSVAIAR